MTEPSHDAQQVCIHMKFGWLPVVMVRMSVPTSGYGWEWGRWRMARLGEIVRLNSLLSKTWRD